MSCGQDKFVRLGNHLFNIRYIRGISRFEDTYNGNVIHVKTIVHYSEGQVRFDESELTLEDACLNIERAMLSSSGGFFG